MTRQSVAYRLVSEGKTQLINDFHEISESGGNSAKRIGRDFERSAADAEAALKRLEEKAAKLEMARPTESGATNRINPITGGSYDGGSRSGAEAAKALIAEQDRLIAQRNVILSQIDPLFAAQLQYNAAIETATELRRREILTEEQYVLVERAAMEALNDTVRAHASGGVSMGQLRAGAQQLGYQFQDLGVQLAMAASSGDVFKGSVMAISMQAPQVVSAIGLMKGESKGLIGVLAGPWGSAFMAATSVAAILGAQMLNNSDASKKAEEAARDFADRQDAISNFVDTTTGALKEQNRTLILNAILMRQANIAANEKTITDSRNDAFDRARQASLRSVRAAPGTTIGGVSFEDDADVQKVIQRAGGDVDRLAKGLAYLAQQRPELGNVARDVSAIGGQAILAARENAKLAEELRALKGDTSALRVEDEASRDARLRLATATDAVSRAQAQRDLIEREAKARIAATTAGTKEREKAEADYVTAVRSANQAVERVRDSERAAAQARRDGARAVREAAKDHRELEQSLAALERRYDPGAARLRDYREELSRIDALVEAGMLSANRAAEWRMNLKAANLLPDLREALKPSIEAEDEATQRAARLDQHRGEEADRTSLLRTEWELRGRSRQDVSAILELEQYRLDILRQFTDLTSDEVAELASVKREQIAINQSLEEREALLTELRSVGEQAIDALFDIRSAESWGDRVKSILIDLTQEMLTLAALNPLKNALFGSNLPVLGGLLDGLLGGGGSSAATQVIPSSIGINPGFAATGTEYASGGAMWLAENGPELVTLPAGSRVTPAAETRRLLGGSGQAPVQVSISMPIDATGADAAGLARVEASVIELRRTLPTQIAETMREVDARSHGRWRAANIKC